MSSRSGFRVESGLLFIDESGQLQPPHVGSIEEVGVIAGLLIPDTHRDHEVLANLVSQLRFRRFGDRSCSKRIKGMMLDPSDYMLIASTIRTRWCVGFPAVGITTDVPGELSAMFATTLDAIEVLRKRLAPPKHTDVRIDFLRAQYARAAQQHPVYLALLFDIYLHIARWFRRNGILPQLRVWLDDKLRRVDTELHDFFGRFAVWNVYPEIYKDRLGEMLGVDPNTDFACYISSDDEQEGLIIADAIAHARSCVLRNADPTGMYRAALDAMVVAD